MDNDDDIKYTELNISILKAVKDAIVNKHNELRSKVAKGKEKNGVDGGQPKASNMRKLVWNDELAEVAQRQKLLILLRFKCQLAIIFLLYKNCSFKIPIVY